jgi:hypothetical protein
MDEPLWIRRGEAETYRMVCREYNGKEADLSFADSVFIRMRQKTDDAAPWMEFAARRDGGGAVSFYLNGEQTTALDVGRYLVQVRANATEGFRTFPKPGFEEAAVIDA